MSNIEQPYMKRAFIASLKRTAQNLNADISKKQKLETKIAEMQKEVDMINLKINAWDEPIKAVTGGYGTEELINKVVEDAGVDKNGKVIKSTKFVLKYPETVIPPHDAYLNTCATTVGSDNDIDNQTQEEPKNTSESENLN